MHSTPKFRTSFWLLLVGFLLLPRWAFFMDQRQSDWLSKALTMSDQGRHQMALAYTDSLITDLDEFSTDEQVRVHLVRGKAFRYTSQDIKAMQQWNKLIAKAKPTNEKAEANYLLGELYFDQKSFEIALEHYQKALRIYADLDDTKNVARSQYKAGIVQKKLEDYPAAIGLFEAVLRSEHQDDMRNALCHDELGKIYYEQADFDLSLREFALSNEQYRKYDFSGSLVENLHMIALIHKIQGQHEDAITCLKEAAEVSQKHGDTRAAVRSLLELAQEQRATFDLRNAIKTHRQAMDITPPDEVENVANEWLSLAVMLGESDQDMQAELAFYEAYAYAKDHDLPKIMEESARLQSRWFEEKGLPEKAYLSLKRADSLSVINSYAQISKLKREISENKLSSETYLRDARDARTQMEEARDSYLWKVIIIGIVFFVIIIGFLLREFTQKRKLSKILEWKVYKRTRELRKANKELNTYIYKSSHDLRTPLTSIKSLLRLLDKEEHNISTRKYLGLISSCSEQMDDILMNLSRAVDFKKVDIKIEQIDFNKLKFEIEQKELQNIKDVQLVWNIDEGAPFFSDFKLLKVILIRTIKNAIDYRKGTDQDFCKVIVHTDINGATLEVQDNGLGVSEKVKDNIFDMFVKGTNKSKGAGLGLYLVKIACDKLRGKVRLENNEHKGATLVFQLPNLADMHP